MDRNPNWLPELVQIDPWEYSGKNNTYELLYSIFYDDFVKSKPRYESREVWYFNNRDDYEDGKEKIFWHLTSRELKNQPIPRRKRKVLGVTHKPAERYPDFRRAERLRWVRVLIEHSNEAEILAWDYLEGDGSSKTYVWLKNWDFVVIMKKYHSGGRRLVTSYYVDNNYTRQDFERKHKSRIQ